MNASPKTILERHEYLLPSALFLLFMALTLPGIAWGAPDGWHPDEVVYLAIRALHDSSFDFDASNFNHPHLPIYLMLGLGKLIAALGGADREVMIGARVLSATLVGLTVVLAYLIPRRMGYGAYVSGLSGLLLISISEMTHNGHFAHNDTFVTFFSALMVYLLVLYKTTSARGWLYATFFSAGLAVSSKYSAVSLAMVPLIFYLWSARRLVVKRPLRVFETLFIGGVLVYLGYAAGTPKALTWMAFYIKRLLPALQHNANFWVLPDSVRGLFGQYEVFMHGVGVPLFVLFGLALVWGLYRVFTSWRHGALAGESNRALLLLVILVIDLPIMVSYNYPVRFFLPLMPFFAMLGAFFLRDLYELAQARMSATYTKLIGAGLAFILLFSLGRVVGVMLLFVNDARLPASAYLKTLPAGSSLEHTFYPPTIPEEHFEREHNYPLFFQKSADATPPPEKGLEFNTGEAGLNDRLTDYLVVDSFTSERFGNPYICAPVQVECDFFQQLATGQSEHYQLSAELSYHLPPWLPQVVVDFVNPTIRIYERKP